MENLLNLKYSILSKEQEYKLFNELLGWEDYTIYTDIDNSVLLKDLIKFAISKSNNYITDIKAVKLINIPYSPLELDDINMIKKHCSRKQINYLKSLILDKLEIELNNKQYNYLYNTNMYVISTLIVLLKNNYEYVSNNVNIEGKTYIPEELI